MYTFDNTYQYRGGKLSDNVIQVDNNLQQIIQKKGLDPQNADSPV